MLILQIKISKVQDLMTLERTGMEEGIGSKAASKAALEINCGDNHRHDYFSDGRRFFAPFLSGVFLR